MKERKSKTNKSSKAAANCIQPVVQPKLKMGQPNDTYEQEADAVADQVMRMPEATVQRKCAGCEQEEEEIQRKPLIQQKASTRETGREVQPWLQQQIERSRGTGQKLPSDTRSFMESRMGRNFEDVNIHHDGPAVRMSRALGAKAFTVGNDIFFNSGQYAPESADGKRLLAHELTHTVQQGPVQTDALQKKGKHDETPELCGGTWSCAASSNCRTPDNPGDGPFESNPEDMNISGGYNLTVHVDIEAPSLEDIDTSGNVGHTFVEFNEPSGAKYTYGFYPDPSAPTPDPSGITGSRTAPGCMVHPDASHYRCVDFQEVIYLNPNEYYTALDFAQSFCESPRTYHLFNNNCTSFAGAVAAASGHPLPNMTGSRSIPFAGQQSIDNPNTLLESLRERDN